MELKRYRTFIHYNLILDKFSKSLSKGGKVHKVSRHLHRALSLYKFNAIQNPIATLLRLEKRVRVLFTFKLIKRGRTSYKVPVILEPHKQLLRFIKVFVAVINSSSKKTNLTQKLFSEFMAIHKGTSAVLLHSRTMHQEAFNNRGFAHYRW